MAYAYKRKPKLILINGYARAGKDTFASGIAHGSQIQPTHLNFASSLKYAGNKFLNILGLRDSFFEEDFKVKHRDTLVAMGRFARSIDQDVFARCFCGAIQRRQFNMIGEGTRAAVTCSDWRYVNEYKLVVKELGNDFDIVTVRINTVGLLPANEEEGLSIAAIMRELPIMYEYDFAPNSQDDLQREGYLLAKKLGL